MEDGRTMKCNTARNQSVVDNYISKFNPYESKHFIGIDLVALTRYVKKKRKTTKELNDKEISLFIN